MRWRDSHFRLLFRRGLAVLLSAGLLSGSPALAVPPSCHELLQRVESFFSGRPVPRPAAVRARSVLLELLDSRSLSDPEVYRLFVRRADQPVGHPYYVRNMADGLREVFAPWFQGLSSMSYQRMLKLQHATVTMGLDGKSPYRSTSLDQPLERARIGKLRFEKSNIFSKPILQVGISDVLTASEQEALFRKAGWDKRIGTRESFPVEGVSPRFYPVYQWMRFYGRSGQVEWAYRFHYPEDWHTQEYVERLEELMGQIRDLPIGVEDKVLFRVLAEYVRVFSVALPFERVNFSIAMAQVNYVLLEHGFRGVEHGQLDLISLSHTQEQFEIAFSAWVGLAQSGHARP